MSRLICLVLTLAMVGCGQHVTPFASAGSQPAMPNSEALAAKPAESVTAYVAYKNDTTDPAVFTVQWSYAANPLWHLEVERCVNPGKVFDTKVVYNHIQRGPQIRFVADHLNNPCGDIFHITDRAIVFRSMNFYPDAHFDVETRFKRPGDLFTLCAQGGGNKQVCTSRLPPE